MSAFKKFTDFCGGFAAFAAIFYLFREFMPFKPKEDPVSLIQKVKLFFSDEPQFEYRPYLLLILFLVLSVLVSLIFHRLPYVAFPVSLLPLARSFDMLEREEIYERAMFYVVLAVLHAFGILWECVRRDREDGRQRSALALNLGAATVALVSFLIFMRPRALVGTELTEVRFFDRILLQAMLQGESFAIFQTMAVVFLVTCAVGFLLWELHYLQAAFAIGVAFFTVLQWSMGSFAVYGSVLPTMAVSLAIGRIVVMLSCAPSRRKRRN